jgi:hypothetical protein
VLEDTLFGVVSACMQIVSLCMGPPGSVKAEQVVAAA